MLSRLALGAPALVLAFIFAVGPPSLLFAFLMTWKEPLEQRFARTELQSDDRISGIVVLGGHIARAREALLLAFRFPEARIILSGGRFDEEALLAKEMFPSRRLEVERAATNTFENARFAKALASPGPGDRWVLVTSALHMPRAMGTFLAQGFRVEPWATYDSLKEERYVAPVVMHELVGLLAYRLMGRTTSLFPATEATERGTSGHSKISRLVNPNRGTTFLARLSSRQGPTLGRVMVRIDPAYLRPTEVNLLLGGPWRKARDKLGWNPTTPFADLVAENLRLADFETIGGGAASTRSIFRLPKARPCRSS